MCKVKEYNIDGENFDIKIEKNHNDCKIVININSRETHAHTIFERSVNVCLFFITFISRILKINMPR